MTSQLKAKIARHAVENGKKCCCSRNIESCIDSVSNHDLH